MSTPAPTPAAPSSGGSSVLKIILIVVAVIAVFVVGGIGLLAYGCYHVAHSIVQNHDGKTTVSIPGAGSFSANESKSFSAEDLGTDPYPGATVTDGGSKLDLANVSMVTAVYSTSDPVSKVEAFYKEKLGSTGSIYSTSDTSMLSKKVSENETVTVTISSKHEEDGKTKIVILHSKKK